MLNKQAIKTAKLLTQSNIFFTTKVILYSNNQLFLCGMLAILQQQEFLNSSAPSELPPHCQKLKLGATLVKKFESKN